MADLDERLAVLTAVIGDPPPTGELEARVARRRRRRRVGQGVGGLAVVVVIVTGAVALTGGESHQTTVRSASPAFGAAPESSSTTIALPNDTPVVLDHFEAGGLTWTLSGRRMSLGVVCLELSNGPLIAPGHCWQAPFNQSSAVLRDYQSFRMVLGLVAPGARAVRIGGQPVKLLGADAGFGASFVAWVVPPGSDGTSTVVEVDGAAIRPEVVPVDVANIHGRVDSVNGQLVAGPPTVATTAPVQTGPAAPATTTPQSSPSTTTATTVPPTPTGQAKRVTVTPAAMSLHKHTFDSAVATAGGVLVTFWDGVEPCSVLGKVDVVETATTVTITLWTGFAQGDVYCPDIAQLKETVVTLAAPLGSRKVIDGAK